MLVTKLRINAFIATLGVGLLLEGLPGKRLRRPGRHNGAVVRLDTSATSGSSPVPIAFLLLSPWSRRSPGSSYAAAAYGHHLVAIGGDPDVARLSGVRNDRVLIVTHALCSLCAGLAGIYLASRLGSERARVGAEGFYDLESIAAVVLGGTCWPAASAVRRSAPSAVSCCWRASTASSTNSRSTRSSSRCHPRRHHHRGGGRRQPAGCTAAATPRKERRDDDRPHRGAAAGTVGARPRGQPAATGRCRCPSWRSSPCCWYWSPSHSPTSSPRPRSCRFWAGPPRSSCLAAGQYFVIVAGEFDLSVGSLVTAQVVVAARLIDSDPGRTWPVVLVLFAFGLLVGVVNGIVTTTLRVPSFITTLGMYSSWSARSTWVERRAPRRPARRSSVSSVARPSKRGAGCSAGFRTPVGPCSR